MLRINLSMRRKSQSEGEKILKLLEQAPVTPDEVAQRIGMAWATAQGHLLKLVATGKVVATRKGRVNVYSLRFPTRISPKVPSWAKARDLEDLSKELEAYFPSGISAAETIESERRRS